MAFNRVFVLVVVVGLMLVGRMAWSAVLVSGDDKQVRATTICADSSGQNIVLFWESKQFSSGSEHLRFNRSANGGRRWKTQPFEFPLNNNYVYFSDYLPETVFDQNGTLHVLWSQRSDTQSPSYVQTTNMGDTWSAKSNIGKSNLPRYEGLALCAAKDASGLWAFYADYDWHSYVCTSAGSGKSWAVVDGPAAGDPLKGFCSSAAAYGERRYVLRIRDDKPEVLAYDGAAWSIFVIDSTSGPVSMAENHSIAVDSKGRVYVVYAESGKVWCLRSDDQGKSFSKVVVATGEGVQVPVITVTGKDSIAVAWQQGNQVRYSVSSDVANSFADSKIIARSSSAQTAPDICSVGESLYFSFTQDGSAWFAGYPDVPVVSSTRVSGKNLLSNSNFDAFRGQAPTGWTVDSWNQKFLKERYGRGKPGRGGTGSCLEMKEGSGASIIEFTGPKTAVEADTTYVLKGYYASTCEKMEVIGTWLDSKGREISSTTLTLPETQEQWTEFFDQISSPIGSVSFRINVRKKWQTGRARFDDFSLRLGTLQNFAKEFSLPPLKAGELRYPIFGWCVPGGWSDGNTYPLKFYNSDRAFAEYAMANFTVGSAAKFGTMRQGAGWTTNDDDLIKDGKDPSVAWIHGGDEPGMSAFPDIAKTHERVKRLAPNKPFLINLLPTYGFPSYAAFEEYLDAYIKIVKPKIFTYDFYSLGGPNNGYSKDFFGNYEIARKHALKNNIDWGVILGVTAFGGIRSPNDAELRWQAFTSLAYGSKMLGWFTYLTEVEYGGMNWRDAAINWDGSRSRHYTMLRRLNSEVLKLGNVLLRLKSTGVYHTKPLPELTRDIKESELVKGISTGQWVLGEFTDSKNHTYFMLANRDYAKSQKAVVTFNNGPKSLSVLSVTTGKWMNVSGYDKKAASLKVSIPKGDARLFKIE